MSNFAYVESEYGNQVVVSSVLDTTHHRSVYVRVKILISAAAGNLCHSTVGAVDIQPGEKLREPNNKNQQLDFPPDLLAAAGVPSLSREEVARLAALRTGA